MKESRGICVKKCMNGSEIDVLNVMKEWIEEKEAGNAEQKKK